MENGSKIFVVDLSIECFLDIKSHSMRFVVSNKSDQETVLAKIPKTIILNEDIDPGIQDCYFSKSVTLLASGNYNYKISSQETDYNCFDEKSLIRGISIAIANKAVNLTSYEEPKDEFIKDLDPKRFRHVKTKNKSWFKNWITKIINKKITSFVLYSNKMIIASFDIDHVNLVKTALGSFSIKRWHSHECEVIKNIISHKNFLGMDSGSFKRQFPNRLAIKCLKYSFIDNDRLKFVRDISEEDQMIFDRWEECLTLKLKEDNCSAIDCMMTYGNIPIPSDFIDGMYMITDKIKVDDRRDFVQAIGISKCIFDRANNTFGILSVNDEKLNSFSDIATTIELFTTIYNSYYSGKEKYIKRICDYVATRKMKVKKNNKKSFFKLESMVSLYPGCVDSMWDKIIEEDNLIVVKKKAEESFNDYF